MNIPRLSAINCTYSPRPACPAHLQGTPFAYRSDHGIVCLTDPLRVE